MSGPAARSSSGLGLGTLAYIWWGLTPILLHLFRSLAPTHILCFRIITSLPLLLVLLATRPSGDRLSALHRPTALRTLAFAAVVIAGNWLLYIYGVASGRLIDVSLGYFVIPFISAAAGALFLNGRLTGLTVVAIAIAFAGVLWLIVERRAVPVLALTLAVTFVGYAYIRKAAAIAPVKGLTIETIMRWPLAVGWLFIDHGFTGAAADPDRWLKIAGCGSMVVPMLLFTAAAKRMRLADLGFLQFISPSLQLALAVFVYREPITASELGAFALIWTGLAVYVAALGRAANAAAKARPGAAGIR